MAAMTVSSVLENSAAAEILRKQDAIQAEFDRVQTQIDELAKAQARMTKMKASLAKLVTKPVDSAPEWLDPVKFPSELAVEPSKITKVHDWADVVSNAFDVGPRGDSTSNQDIIQDVLYAIQVWSSPPWDNGTRGTVEPVKMTRLALSPNAAYYEGEWGRGVDIYKTTDGETFELWFHECEEYPCCFPQLIKDEIEEGPEKGTEYVYLFNADGKPSMCSRVTLSDGSECWVADKSKKIPEDEIEAKLLSCE